MQAAQPNIGGELRASSARSVLQVPRYLPHTADRYFPFSGFIADQVVKKAAVLQQRRIVRMSEDPDFGIGKDKSADQIILQIPLDGRPERLFGQASPGLLRYSVCLKLFR